MLKKLYVGLLDESERQGLIDSALDTGIDNVEGYALHVRSEKLGSDRKRYAKLCDFDGALPWSQTRSYVVLFGTMISHDWQSER